MKSLLFILCALLAQAVQAASPMIGPETEFTRELKRQTNAANWRAALGVPSTNASEVATLALSGAAQDAASWRAGLGLDKPINVKWPEYGAVGDGITDDWAAIQLAINTGSTGATIYLPRGRYKITQPLTNSLSNVAIKGEGNRGSTVIVCSGEDAGIHLYSDALAQVYGNRIEDIAIFGDGTTKAALKLTDCQESYFRNLHVLNCQTGLVVTGSSAILHFEDFHNSYNGTGVLLDYVNKISFTASDFFQNTNEHFRVHYATAASFTGGWVEKPNIFLRLDAGDNHWAALHGMTVRDSFFTGASYESDRILLVKGGPPHQVTCSQLNFVGNTIYTPNASCLFEGDFAGGYTAEDSLVVNVERNNFLSGPATNMFRCSAAPVLFASWSGNVGFTNAVSADSYSQVFQQIGYDTAPTIVRTFAGKWSFDITNSADQVFTKLYNMDNDGATYWMGVNDAIKYLRFMVIGSAKEGYTYGLPNANQALLTTSASSLAIGTDVDAPLRFISNANPRWEIDSAGNLLSLGGYLRYNNNTWQYSTDAANTNNIATIGVDTANQVSIAPGGYPTVIGGALKMGNTNLISTTRTVIESDGTTNVWKFINGSLYEITPQ